MTPSIEHSPESVPEDARVRARRIEARLDELGLAFRTRWHAPVFTVEESRTLRGAIEGAHTKNLFVKDKKGRLFLLVCEEATAVDLKSVHRLIGAQGRVSFAGPEPLAAHLGVEPGSVTALAAMNDEAGAVTLVLDRTLLDHDTINAHPLTNHATTSIGRDDLLTFLAASGHRPIVVDFSQAAPQDTDTGSAS